MRRRSWQDRVIAVILAACFATPANAQESLAGPSFTVTPEDASVLQPTVIGTPTTVAAGYSRLYASVDVLWLARDYPQNSLLAQTVALDSNFKPVPLLGAPVLTLGNVSDPAAQPGLRVRLGFRIIDNTSIELGYFGLQEWNQVAGIRAGDPPFANSPYLGTSIIYGNKSFDTSITGQYSSHVNSVEANLRESFNFGFWNASVLGGIRYFNLSEQFTLTGFQTFPNIPFPPGAPPVNQTIVEQTRTTTSNNLFGAQIGAEVGRAWFNDRFGLALNGKVGIFANNANQYTTNGANLVTGGSPTNVLASGRGSTDFASLYEGGLATTVRVTSRIKVRAGYQVLFVQGLALAPTQLFATGTAIQKSFVPVQGSFIPPNMAVPATTLPVPGTASTLTTNGNLLLHGPFVGLDVSY
ncbi:MAG: BBP7 family outer membrane beta-barrel protein [Planctomycetes bacterium]|nr:BBP7 family outer membrane beta-barrel protein [Planctomycetota bacterium]